MSRDRCSVDTETTSLLDPHLPGGRRVWEIAIIRDTAYGPLCAWLQITDVDLAAADPTSLRIGRFYDRFHPDAYGPIDVPLRYLPGRAKPVMLWGSTEAEAAETIDELTAGAIITASNPAFDMASLADLLRRHGREPSWYHHPLDVPNAALGHLRAVEPARWQEPSYPTSALSEGCGVPEPEDRHSAWADAVWMRDWDDVLRGARPKDAVPGILPG